MEIINSVEIMEAATKASGLSVIILAIGSILIGIGLASCCFEGCNPGGIASLVFGGTILLFSLATIYEELNTEVPTGRYRYECIVDEDYSVLELTEQYNIIDHDGNRYVLEDKEAGQSTPCAQFSFGGGTKTTDKETTDTKADTDVDTEENTEVDAGLVKEAEEKAATYTVYLDGVEVNGNVIEFSFYNISINDEKQEIYITK